MAFLKYSLYRLLIIVAFTALLIWLGAHPYLAVAIAAILGALVSYLVLPRTRQEVVEQMAAHDPLRRRMQRTDTASAEEDAALEGHMKQEPLPEPAAALEPGAAPAPGAATEPSANSSQLDKDQHDQQRPSHLE